MKSTRAIINEYRDGGLIRVKGTSCTRRYACAQCGAEITTDAATWPPTRRAVEAIDRHVATCVRRSARDAADAIPGIARRAGLGVVREQG